MSLIDLLQCSCRAPCKSLHSIRPSQRTHRLFSPSARQGSFSPMLCASGHAPSSSERAGDEGTRWGGLPPPQTSPPSVVSEAPRGWVGARKRVFSSSGVGGYFSLSARQGRFFPTLRASGHARSSSERAGDAGTRWGGLPPPQTSPLGVVSEAPHGWAGARKRVFSACAAAMTGKKFHQV